MGHWIRIFTRRRSKNTELANSLIKSYLSKLLKKSRVSFVFLKLPLERALFISHTIIRLQEGAILRRQLKDFDFTFSKKEGFYKIIRYQTCITCKIFLKEKANREKKKYNTSRNFYLVTFDIT